MGKQATTTNELTISSPAYPNIIPLGAVITLTDAEYAALDAVSLASLSSITTVADPARPSPTSGNLARARVLSAASTNATSVKAASGKLVLAHLSNAAASARFLKLYDKATAPVVGTDTPVSTFLLPAGTTTRLDFTAAYGDRYANGIAYAITGGVADTDTTAVAANDVTGLLNYL